MTAMGWFITADVGEFLAEAGEFLRAGRRVTPSCLTRTVAGMVRAGPVHTPPELRRRGYASAATVTVSLGAERGRPAGAHP